MPDQRLCWIKQIIVVELMPSKQYCVKISAFICDYLDSTIIMSVCIRYVPFHSAYNWVQEVWLTRKALMLKPLISIMFDETWVFFHFSLVFAGCNQWLVKSILPFSLVNFSLASYYKLVLPITNKVESKVCTVIEECTQMKSHYKKLSYCMR